MYHESYNMTDEEIADEYATMSIHFYGDYKSPDKRVCAYFSYMGASGVVMVNVLRANVKDKVHAKRIMCDDIYNTVKARLPKNAKLHRELHVVGL